MTVLINTKPVTVLNLPKRQKIFLSWVFAAGTSYFLLPHLLFTLLDYLKFDDLGGALILPLLIYYLVIYCSVHYAPLYFILPKVFKTGLTISPINEGSVSKAMAATPLSWVIGLGISYSIADGSAASSDWSLIAVVLFLAFIWVIASGAKGILWFIASFISGVTYGYILFTSLNDNTFIPIMPTIVASLSASIFTGIGLIICTESE